jgi:2-polyprenyl-6-methoxyphenol hydroxylase-like FAD-dependent oxidoreductase
MILFVCPTWQGNDALTAGRGSTAEFPSSSWLCPRKSNIWFSKRRAPLMQSGPPPLHVGIAGAGISGLSTALGLLRTPGTNVGQVTVFDPRTGLDTGLGGALNLNGGAAVLAKCYGIDVSRIGKPMRGVVGRVADGSAEGGDILFKFDIEEMVKRSAIGGRLLIHDGRVMAMTVMRDRLQELLCEELKNENVVVRRGARVSGIKQVDATGKLRFAFSNGVLSEEQFDLCVGADGLRSTVREHVVGNARSSRYSGLRVQFAISEPRVPKEVSDGLAHAWFGNGVYCLQYAAGSPYGAEQELLAVCFKGESPTDENPAYQEADVRTDCKERLVGAGMPTKVMGLFNRCNRFVDVGVYYHEPLNSWHDRTGRCTLVGDAGLSTIVPA